MDETNEKTESHSQYEVQRLRDCAHPNVVKLFGSTKTSKGDWLILLEHAPHGDIQSFYKKIRSENDGDLPRSALPISKRLEFVF